MSSYHIKFFCFRGCSKTRTPIHSRTWNWFCSSIARVVPRTGRNTLLARRPIRLEVEEPTKEQKHATVSIHLADMMSLSNVELNPAES